ncbi:hypothetical protein ABAC460_22650 [Asticcacaulis sp. AC460]|uniref:hypothetical protein n=1 Tax=Asticcacaulis sp. AC460 TaxID=1282360 RepID=UPI0003C3DE4A|nr:hypothetical protein [Asticcacaulis sp. AC460]ESQ86630.1 hypothetical protein ABAC460_22650 [Asticcacaulis sp. AC460]
MKALFPSLIVLLAAPAAQAADLSVAINDTAGKPVSFAVVTWTPKAGAAIPASLKSAAYVMTQKNVQFTPFVLAVPVGATVSFPNQDRVNHHVYSFSPAMPFQLPLYGKGQTRTVTFTKPGTDALGCNIHDSMSAYIHIVNTPYFATTGPDGKIILKGVPDGAGALKVWHPLMDAPDHEVARAMTAGKTNAPQAFSVKVRARLTQNGSY